MKRKCSLFMVMLLVVMLLISTAAIPVSAATTYTPIGGSTTLVKNLVVDADANIPDITFHYSLRRGKAVLATPSTIEILVSDSGGGTIEEAVFTNADTAGTISGLPSDTDPTNPTAGKKYAQKTITITLPDNSFNKPGVYRYEVTEETDPALPGVTYDESSVRYLDVFVVADDDDVLAVSSYVLRDSATTIGIDGAYTTDPSDKSSGYTNSITQYDFDFSKTIAGNQGDKNKRFHFTLNITGTNPGTYPVVTNDVTGNPTTITVGANGIASAEYSLTNNSTVQIIGLNAGAICTVEENAEDYTPTHSLDGAAAIAGNNSGAITLANSNHSVAFTNTRNGIIPTGIIMTIAPFAIGILVFGAVIIFIIIRRKRHPY